MALTPDQIAALQATRAGLVTAMRSGAREVQHGDKRVQYRSIAEMKVALDGIDAELAEGTGKRRRRVMYIHATRGL